MGPSLPKEFATVAGNLFELNQFSGLRLLDVRFPPPFLDRYHGPRFGVEGTRRLCGVWGRPVIGTIVKPSVGLTAESTAAVVGELAAGGIDFIKDNRGPGHRQTSGGSQRRLIYRAPIGGATHCSVA
ncbi:MAG: RuBisCO large subunit C-terminal-like domain-containing protein [Bryobacteraceae bacterium]